MSKEIFIVRNRITSQTAILDCSEAAAYSHRFSKIFPENTGGRVLLLVKLLTVQSSNYILKWLHQVEIFRLDCSERAAHSYPFSIISRENTNGRVLLLVKL